MNEHPINKADCEKLQSVWPKTYYNGTPMASSSHLLKSIRHASRLVFFRTTSSEWSPWLGWAKTRRPFWLLLLFSLAVVLLHGPIRAQETESLYFGLVEPSGQLNLERAEELFGPLGEVSRVQTLSSRFVPYTEGGAIERLRIAASYVGDLFPSGVTFQVRRFEGSLTSYLRFACPETSDDRCTFSEDGVLSIDRDEYEQMSRVNETRYWSTYKNDRFRNIEGYTPLSGERGLLFEVEYLLSGEIGYLDISEVYDVRSPIVRAYRSIILNDRIPSSRQVPVYRYFFQLGYGVFLN